MRIELFDPATEPGKVAACYRMYADGLPFDDPGGAPFSANLFAGWLTEGFAREPREVASALDSAGHPVGAYLLELPHRDNTHIAALLPMVPPAERRQGYGAALLRHAAGRQRPTAGPCCRPEAKSDEPGSAFAAAMGARAGVLEVRRVLET